MIKYGSCTLYKGPVCGGLTHWGRVTHICVSELTIIVSDNGLSPGRRQAIIWTNVGILLIGPYGTTFSEILIEILIFSFTKMSLKVSSAKWGPFCLSLNVLNMAIWSIEVLLEIYRWVFTTHQVTSRILPFLLYPATNNSLRPSDAYMRQ